jgi:hypothetical protein
MISKYRFHPACLLFPPLPDEELRELADDIQANGLQKPVVRSHGIILDGRNRLLACEKAGVEPGFVEHTGDEASALALVISLNVQRRELTGAQRALVGSRTWGLDGKRAGRPNKEEEMVSMKPFSLDQLAKQFHVSKRSILQARDLLNEAPDLAEQVDACALSLAAAHEQLLTRRKEVAQKSRDAERVTEYTDAIGAGEMSLEKALQKAIDRERREREDQAAEADARGQWLKRVAEWLDWTERFIAQRNDEHLSWYTLPGAPGLFDHGITADRIGEAISQWRRVYSLTFGGSHAKGKTAK